MSTEDLLAEVRALERRCRVQTRWVGALIACVVVVGVVNLVLSTRRYVDEREVHAELKTRRLEVVDAQGRTIALLDHASAGGGSLMLSDGEHRHVQVRATSGRGELLLFGDHDDPPALHLLGDAKSGGLLTVIGASRIVQVPER